MRVTVEENTDEMVIRVEGRLVEPWTSELESTWAALPLGSKRLSLDISGMLFADNAGKRILKEIVGKTNCRIRADSPLTRDFADEIISTRTNPNRGN
jgi:hypothetical protein